MTALLSSSILVIVSIIIIIIIFIRHNVTGKKLPSNHIPEFHLHPSQAEPADLKPISVKTNSYPHLGMSHFPVYSLPSPFVSCDKFGIFQPIRLPNHLYCRLLTVIILSCVNALAQLYIPALLLPHGRRRAWWSEGELVGKCQICRRRQKGWVEETPDNDSF